MAFVSDLVSADCTLRHVETISSEQLGQRYFMYRSLQSSWGSGCFMYRRSYS